MKVTNIAQSAQTQQVQRKGRKQGPDSVKKTSDKVEISSEAKKLSQSNNISAAAAKSIKNAPEVRQDKLAEIREKIQEGFYNQKDLTTILADNILKEFGL